MYDTETNEHYVWYVSNTQGGEYSPSSFNVTRLGETYVATLLEGTRLVESLDVASIEFDDCPADFAAPGYQMLDGEEDPRCILSRNRLCDVVEHDVEKVFLSQIPVSLETALASNEFDGGLRVRMYYVSRNVSGYGTLWQGTPKHMENTIETVPISVKELVQVSDWLATARKVGTQ